MDIIDSIIHYFKHQNSAEKELSPKGVCSMCWGRQQYDGKIRKLLVDKQIDVNNHKDSYMFIQQFMKTYIDGIQLKKGVIMECPNCSKKNESWENTNPND